MRKEIKEVISFDRVSCSASFLCTVTMQHHHHHPRFTITGTITKCLNSQILGLVGLLTKSQNTMGVVYFRKALGTSTSNMMIPGVNCVNFHNMPIVDQSLNHNF